MADNKKRLEELQVQFDQAKKVFDSATATAKQAENQMIKLTGAAEELQLQSQKEDKPKEKKNDVSK